MIPAIHIAQPEALVSDGERIRNAVDRSAYALPGANVQYWACEGWQVLEQAYDLPDVYVSYIEVRVARADTSIPIKCPRDDLYWLYLLSGGMAITPADSPKTLAETTENRYRVSYFPTGSYLCTFDKGLHRIFYVVHKAKALLREASKELDWGIAPVESLKARLGSPSVSDSLSMRDGSAEAIRKFLFAPGNTFLKRKQALEYLSLDLVFFAYESLNQQAGGKRIGAEWAEKMKGYIDRCVADGLPVDTGGVAGHTRISYGYAKAAFKALHGVAISHYITQRKLAQGRLLLDAGESPTQAAIYVCWDYAHFSKAFKARYGVSPRDYLRLK